MSVRRLNGMQQEQTQAHSSEPFGQMRETKKNCTDYTPKEGHYNNGLNSSTCVHE